MKKKSFNTDAMIAMAFIGVILLLIIPLPPFLLDLLICFSFTFSLMSLLSVLFVKDPIEFSSFPSLLLFLTLYRLGLNVASTRLILAEGEAGKIIHTFGEFVIKENTSVGLILFLLLALVNFIVITKGAGRIAEVSARFILEALPGKQLAIDSDLQRGMLSLSQGKKARLKLQQEADFYGAMDGASKFIRGDAIATLIITFVNILGGILIGLFSKGLSVSDCWVTYTCLTIGDGLVTQIPAVLISVSAGLMLTSSSQVSVSQALAKQMWMSPKVLLITGVSIFLLGFIPGMPLLVLLPLSLALCISGIRILNKREEREDPADETSGEIATLLIPPIEIALGKELLKSTDKISKECLAVRTKVANMLGIVLPAEHIKLETLPSALSYQIKIKDVIYLTSEKRALFSTNFEKILIQNAHLLLHRQEVSGLIENARIYDAAVVEELIPKKLSIGSLLKVLQNLLREKISIRDFISILEILADHIKENDSTDLEDLTEIVRQKMSRSIFTHLFEGKEVISVITLDPKVEAMISAATSSKTLGSPSPMLLPKMAEKLTFCLKEIIEKKKEESPIILTNTSSRRHLRRLIEKQLPDTPVLSYKEMEGDYTLRSVGVISNDVLSC